MVGRIIAFGRTVLAPVASWQSSSASLLPGLSPLGRYLFSEGPVRDVLQLNLCILPASSRLSRFALVYCHACVDGQVGWASWPVLQMGTG